MYFPKWGAKDPFRILKTQGSWALFMPVFGALSMFQALCESAKINEVMMLKICWHLCLSLSLSICPYTISIDLSISPSIYFSIHPSIHLSIHPSMHPSVVPSNLFKTLFKTWMDIFWIFKDCSERPQVLTGPYERYEDCLKSMGTLALRPIFQTHFVSWWQFLSQIASVCFRCFFTFFCWNIFDFCSNHLKQIKGTIKDKNGRWIHDLMYYQDVWWNIGAYVNPSSLHWLLHIDPMGEILLATGFPPLFLQKKCHQLCDKYVFTPTMGNDPIWLFD